MSNFIVTQRIIQNMKKKLGKDTLCPVSELNLGDRKILFVYSLSKFMNEFFPRPLRNLTKYNILINTLKIGLTDTKLNKVDKNKNMKKRIKLILWLEWRQLKRL